ncbi:hypothetical protein BH20ACT18_BH20ACT18_06500 [soil metagenome]
MSVGQAEVDDLIDRWQSAWSGRVADAFAELCAANVHYEDPFTSEPLEGAAALGRHARRLWAAMPDVRLERTGERLTDGTYVAAPCRLLGTQRSRLGPVPATGRFVVVNGVFYGELQEGEPRLKRVRAFFDLYSTAVDVGLLPAAGTVGERALLAIRGFGVRS